VRHAKGATTLHVRLVREGGYFVLEVTDNGQAVAAGSRTGMGLRSMADRAKAINGLLRTGPLAAGEPGYQVQLRVKG
jgi:signal transduction histidine kinase